MHGDSFDGVIRNYRQLSIFGTHAYSLAGKLSIQIDKWRKNLRVNHILEILNLSSHWSLAHAIATRTEDSTYSELYVRTMMNHLFHKNAEIFSRRKHQPVHAQEKYLNGIIGGHTHRADEIDFHSPIDEKTGESIGPLSVKYLNDGHWTGPPGSDLLADTNGEWRENPDKPTCTAVVEYEDGTLGHVQWQPGKGVVPFRPRSKYNTELGGPTPLVLAQAAAQHKTKEQSHLAARGMCRKGMVS